MNKSSPSKLHFSLRIPLIAAGLVVLLAAGGFAGMLRLEETNTFCASCHTQPESEYVGRIGSAPRDLAAAHMGEIRVNCIDCHAGPGLGGRAVAMLGGARNAVLYVTKTMVQPARAMGPFPDGDCVKCHADLLRSENYNGLDNHFHSFLGELKRLKPDQALICVDCHAGHAQDGEAGLSFLNRPRAETACQQCHNAMGEGEEYEGSEGSDGGGD